MSMDQTLFLLREDLGLKAKSRYGNQVEAFLSLENVPSTLGYLQNQGFNHLVNITCVDWLEEGEIEIVYNLWSYSKKVHLSLKARVDRMDLLAPTVSTLWPQAQVYEQELHEMFGVEFQGNPDLSPLFLHNWQDAPPLRKDFDTREYSKKHYGFIEEEATDA